MNASLVEEYLQRFKAALGDDERFTKVFNEAWNDKRLGQPEAVELASKFLAPIAKSTSRPKALRRCIYRHEKLIEARRVAASISAKR
jgi:hypothetical protein